MYLSLSDNSTVSAFLSTLSLEECSHLTLDLGTVPIHNAFPIDSTHATLLQNYPLPSSCLDNLKHQFKQHQMKTWRYQFHPYTSLMSISSSRQTPSHLVKLNDNSHEPYSDIRTEHCWQPFNPSTIQSPSFSQLFNGELGTRVTLPMLEIAMK